MRSSLLVALITGTTLALSPHTAAATPGQWKPIKTVTCTAGGAKGIAGADDCSGSFSGNNMNQHAKVFAELSEFGGCWTLLGSTDDTNAGPFRTRPSGSTGELFFDQTITGPFAIALKAGNSYSLYFFLNKTNATSSVHYSTAGTGVNKWGHPLGLSHATLYTKKGYGPMNVVPEPSSFALVASGLVVLGATARRRRKQ